MNDVFEKIDLNSVDWKSSREFFESLGEALDKLDDKDESYNFTWVGKRKSIVEAGTPINKTLRPDINASKDFDNTKNMLIVGDNLDALKLLQESYLGKIKMIYIDPPYNTGNDFVYHDNFTIKKDDYRDFTKDEEGTVLVSEDEFAENSKANGRFHSDWLSMIYPRLKLARNLLTDDGVIFISIDDNEQANLKKVCDEIFGEDNFVANLIWQNKYTIANDKVNGLTTQTEYILCYAKIGADRVIFTKAPLRKEYIEANYSNLDNDPNGPYMTVQMFKFKNPYSFDVTSPTGKVWNKPWNFTPESFKALDDTGAVYWGLDGNSLPRKKVYLKNSKGVGRRNLLLGEEVGYTADSSKDLRVLFEDGNIFEYTKPASLIKFLINMIPGNDGLILDFFAGSGTTGQATMEKNFEDDGSRRFILVQMDSELDNTKTAKKSGLETVADITKERLRRVGEKISREKSKSLDTGFRVFRIDSNNENENIRKPLNQIDQSDLFNAIDNIKKNRTPLDLLFGVIYASALPFDLKLETRKIGENTVYLYGYLDEGTGLVACFDDNISEETFKEIAKLKALTAAFKDSSFTNSAAKINLSEHFRIICPDTKVKVL